MSDLQVTLKNHVKEAMKAKQKERLAVLRQITAAIKQVEVDTRAELDDTKVLSLLEKMKKQRLDSIAQFKQAGREELADQEELELRIIDEFLPEQLSDQEINQIIEQAIKEVSAEKVSDMAKVMALIKPQVTGKASMKDIGEKIKKILS